MARGEAVERARLDNDIDDELRYSPMSIAAYWSIAVLGSVFANVVHWRGGKAGPFIFHPEHIALQVVYYAWCSATVTISVLFLLYCIPAGVFIVTSMSMCIAQMLYSIACRQQARTNC